MKRKNYVQLEQFDKEDLTSISIDRKIIQRKIVITKQDKIKISVLSVVVMIMVFILYRVTKEVNIIKGECENKEKEYQDSINEINEMKSQMRSSQGQMRSLINYLSSIQKTIKHLQNTKRELLYGQSTLNSRLGMSTINMNVKRQANLYIRNKIKANSFKLKSLYSIQKSLQTEYDSLSKSPSSFLTQSQITQIESWNKIKFLSQCYSATSNNLNPKTFHTNCDKVGSTVTIVLTNYNEIVGGYTRMSWGSIESKADYLSTIFNLSINSIYHLRPFVVGILPEPEHFPYFGHDLYFRGNGSGFSQFPYVYGDPDNKNSDFIINPTFKIKTIEVYQVKEL